MSIQQPKPHNFDVIHSSDVAGAKNQSNNKLHLPATSYRAVEDELLSRARNYCPDQYSCRHFKVSLTSPKFVGGVLSIVTFAALFPVLSLFLAMTWVLLANFAMTSLRMTAIMAMKRRVSLPTFLTEKPTMDTPDMPRISILVPLFKEKNVLPALISNLKALEYPSENLEIKLLLEEVDQVTTDALKLMMLPSYMQVITVPKDWLQTKPKAMNYALPFCTGDIIGVYDAEDRPEPDQLIKVTNHFKFAPANVACIQGNLDFFNSRENWISRCFAIDYSTWFQILLRGIQTLGIPIPLGGTTIFFRRHILIEIGGWDAHNVTEDAELGMRLARFGYRCEMLDTTTWEEANCRPIGWIRQRSRWLKGYAMTWASHMRAPFRLWSELGPTGFVGFQIIMLAGLTSHLAAPLFLALWLSMFGVDILPITQLPDWFWTSFVAIMILGSLVMFLITILAVWTEERKHLIPCILALPFYWLLGALASYKALVEMIIAPFYWDKTSHGHSNNS